MDIAIFILVISPPLASRLNIYLQKWSLKRSTDYIKGGYLSSMIWFLLYITTISILLFKVLYLHHNVSWIGYLILITANIFRYYAFKELKEMYSETITIYKNHNLVKSGVYSYFRHPLHLGLILEIIALSIMSKSVYTIPLVCIAIVTLFFRNIYEEKILKEKFGHEYDFYIENGAWDVIDLLKAINLLKTRKPNK